MTEREKRVQWFMKSRFGLFLHWGLYAIHGYGEWMMSEKNMSAKEYEERYFSQFNPVDFNPELWAQKAKEAGMEYAVLTAKHHDGFCLFDSKYTDYKVTNTPFKRDIVKEYVDAFRKAGIKVGLYYSLLDWHHPNYPKYDDMYHPMRGNEKYKDEKVNFDNYLDYMHNQVKELVTNYGKIDILWFDFSYDGKRNEDWRATELIKMVRTYQKDVLIDNRLETSGEGFGSIITKEPAFFSGDFASPEQIIPGEGIVNELGNPVPWELCTTMNNNWGYNMNDSLYKPSWLLIRKLVECVSKGGNVILNVGPDAKGNFNAQSLSILKDFATWMDKNSASIKGCGNAYLPKPDWGRYTKNGNHLYAHVFEPPIGPLALPGIKSEDIVSMHYLENGVAVEKGDSWITKAYEGVAFASLGPIPHFSYPLLNEIDTVVDIELRNKK